MSEYVMFAGREYLVPDDAARVGADALAACDGNVAQAIRLIRDVEGKSLSQAVAMVHAGKQIRARQP